jgi:phage/plasmid primase-like uncharacterized protein
MIDSAVIDRARTYPIERVAAEHNLKLRGKNERIGPCPICGGTDRFSINIKKQLFNCRGCRKGGDVIAIMQFLDGCDFREACTILTGKAPSDSTEYKQHSNTDDHERQQRNKARYLWHSSKPVAGTPVENYLGQRLNGKRPLSAAVRYLPPLKSDHHPAMIVPYGLHKITAVQLTLLKPDGTGKADIEPNKITIASPAGMPMVVAPPNDLLGLAITEGVEDALSVHCATGLGAWASGGASFMPKLATAVPDYIEAITIYAHADEAGQRGAYELADALDARDIEIRIEGVER